MSAMPPLPPRVLVVEDSLTVRRYYRTTAEAAGFAVDEAENGLEALERALIGGFGLFLVDVNMPTMDGYRFLAEVRSRPETRAVPAILISSDTSAECRARGFASGANICHAKPVEPEWLTQMLGLLLGHQQDA